MKESFQMTFTTKRQCDCKNCGMHYDNIPKAAVKNDRLWYHRCNCGSTVTWVIKKGEESLPDQEFQTVAWEE